MTKTYLLEIQNDADILQAKGILEGVIKVSEETVLQFRDWARDAIGAKGDEVVQILAPLIKSCQVQNLILRFVFCNLSSRSEENLADSLESNSYLVGFTCIQNPHNFESNGNYQPTPSVDRLVQAAILCSSPFLKVFQNEEFPDAVSDQKFVDVLLKWKVGYGEQLDTAKIKALAEVWRNCKKENLPYIDIPNSIIRKGPLAIINFYKLIKKNGGIDPTHRLSILVLGRANVGKTSLIESIKANNKGVLIPAGATRATLGVEMHKIQGNPSKDIFTLINVLDFGGQEDYYATHTLFHRVNGIVLIGFDLSMTIDKTNIDENVLFFIRKIQASNLEGIRFVLVGTKLDLAKEKKIDVDLICSTVIDEFKKAEKNTVEAIHKELNDLHPTEIARRGELENLLANRPRLLMDNILKVSCVSRGKALMGLGGERNAKGIPELVSYLQELAMNEGKQLPNIHLKLLETFISRRSQNSISLAEAKQLAVSNKFEKDEDIVAALEIFRDLNEILWFKNDPLLFNVIFVNPVFVMDIIKPIVRHDLIKNPEGGPSGLEQYFKNNKMLLEEVSSKLQNQGTISTRILREYFFQDEKYQDVFIHIISFDKLLSLLEHFEIGYLVRKGDGDEKLLLPFHIGIGTIAMPSSIYTPKPTNAKLQLVRIWEFLHFFPSGAMTSLAIMLHDLHRVESTLGDNVFQILPNEVCIQILFERQVVDSRIYVQILDSSRVVVRLEITTTTHEGVKSETLKITDRIEKYLQQYPGMLVRRKGIDPEFPQVEVDLDLACQLAAANREDILVNGEAIPLAKLVPEQIHENKFTKQVSFRQGFIAELPFLLPDCDKHFFLSHYQIEFGDACANIQLLLSKFGGVCWFDKRADNITMSEMEYGIKSSVIYTLFLSSKVFTRPYVRYELLKAIELEKPILLLHECEPGRPCFDFGGVNKDDVIPSSVPNETDYVQSRGKRLPELISVLLRESESRPFRRRVEEEESMMKKMLEIVTDEQSLKKRQQVTEHFLKPLLT